MILHAHCDSSHDFASFKNFEKNLRLREKAVENSTYTPSSPQLLSQVFFFSVLIIINYAMLKL
jgi:hypothetical protein